MPAGRSRSFRNNGASAPRSLRQSLAFGSSKRLLCRSPHQRRDPESAKTHSSPKVSLSGSNPGTPNRPSTSGYARTAWHIASTSSAWGFAARSLRNAARSKKLRGRSSHVARTARTCLHVLARKDVRRARAAGGKLTPKLYRRSVDSVVAVNTHGKSLLKYEPLRHPRTVDVFDGSIVIRFSAFGRH